MNSQYFFVKEWKNQKIKDYCIAIYRKWGYGYDSLLSMKTIK